MLSCLKRLQPWAHSREFSFQEHQHSLQWPHNHPFCGHLKRQLDSAFPTNSAIYTKQVFLVGLGDRLIWLERPFWFSHIHHVLGQVRAALDRIGWCWALQKHCAKCNTSQMEGVSQTPLARKECFILKRTSPPMK